MCLFKLVLVAKFPQRIQATKLDLKIATSLFWLFAFTAEKRPNHQKARSNLQSKHSHFVESHLPRSDVHSILNKQVGLPRTLGLSTEITLGICFPKSFTPENSLIHMLLPFAITTSISVSSLYIS